MITVLLVSSTVGVAAVGTATAVQEANETDKYTVVQGDECIAIEPLGQGEQTVSEFYDYRMPDTDPSSYSYSSHGTAALQADDTSVLFLHEGANGLSLVMVHDRYGGGTSGGAATMQINNLPEDGRWVVEDDSYSERDDVFDHRRTASRMTWVWAESRSDGAAFNGGLDDGFEIEIEPMFNDEADFQVYEGGVTDWQVISGSANNHTRTSLEMDQPITIQSGGCEQLTVTDLNVSESVTTGDATAIEATIRNDGALSTTTTVPITVDGETIDSYDVSLDPGETATIRTAVEFEESGTRTVDVAGTTTDVHVASGTDTSYGDSQVGFGVGAAVLAALLAALFAARRR